MKKCPFCAEEIQDEAIKCKHCNEFLDGRDVPKPKEPFYTKGGFILMCLLTIGPFGLPLIWIHPRWNIYIKVISTIAVCLISWWLYQAFSQTFKQLHQAMSSLGVSM